MAADSLLSLANQRLTARRPRSLLAEGGHRGVVGAEGGLGRISRARSWVGAGASQIAEVDEHGVEVAVPGGHLGVATVGGGVEVQPPSWLWLCHSEGPGRAPGPCCWPPRGSQTGGMLLLSPRGTTVRNSAEDLRPARPASVWLRGPSVAQGE